MWIYRNTSLIRCEQVWQTCLQIETPTWEHDTINKHVIRCWVEFELASVTTCDIFCKSLVFGFVNVDSFCYFDNIYDLQIKFISKYLRHIVIYCKRPNQILWILWGDIHNLSQILHYPGNISIAATMLLFYHVNLMSISSTHRLLQHEW